ncbi:trypco2 family protein [Streptomyces sp. Marseille-Q5077]|uniref:trypco2 family protein n=1 Tax=Streptomyces sp. Marseille-Q5077 TaxID=3418995 RepID=UPI003CFED681
MVEIRLADALKALRDELAEATAQAEGSRVRLHVETVSLDLQVAVTDTVEAGGGVKFWLLSADARASATAAVTHTVSLQLKAETDDGGRVLTGVDGAAVRIPLADGSDG